MTDADWGAAVGQGAGAAAVRVQGGAAGWMAGTVMSRLAVPSPWVVYRGTKGGSRRGAAKAQASDEALHTPRRAVVAVGPQVGLNAPGISVLPGRYVGSAGQAAWHA